MSGFSLNLLISALSGILTLFGVKVVEFFIKKNETSSRLIGKEYDDGVERRKELLKEIESYKTVITALQAKIEENIGVINQLKDQIRDDSIKYIKLDNRYQGALSELAKFSQEVANHFKEAADSN